MIRVAIIGASGYTGIESIEILLRHAEAETTYLTAFTETGHCADIFGQLAGRLDMPIEQLDMDKLAQVADVVLCCLPHKVSMGYVPQMLKAGLKVVDFSADYRIKDIATYEEHYVPHTDPDNLTHAVYGLPELYREQIKTARLVANPGCFPTGASLGLAPALKHGLIEPNGIVINSVTGVSGGGKKPNTVFHYPNMNENLLPYKIGSHRHMPEMEQIASDVAGRDVTILFQPHVGPFDRGIISSIYCDPTNKDITAEQLMETYTDFYRNEPFVQVLDKAPAMKHVAKTNHCHIFPTMAKGKVIIFSTIDNMMKGASSQAIQNMNIMFDLPETMGLE